MTFEETVDNIIKKYWQGKAPDKTNSVSKFKYTKKYFDRFEEQEFGSKKDWLNEGEAR
jgi:hypothetical protein